jgi:hypothetical protein
MHVISITNAVADLQSSTVVAARWIFTYGLLVVIILMRLVGFTVILSISSDFAEPLL